MKQHWAEVITLEDINYKNANLRLLLGDFNTPILLNNEAGNTLITLGGITTLKC